METFTLKGYETNFVEFCRLVKHDNSITDHLKNVLAMFITNNKSETYLEIGPGSGLYLYNIVLSGLFNKVVLFEPNENFTKAIKEKESEYKECSMTYFNNKFLDVESMEIPFYDICIMAHVIYYLSVEEIKSTVEKLKSLKKSTLSRAVFSFNTIDAKGNFGFRQICFDIMQEFLNEINKIFSLNIHVPISIKETSNYINTNEITSCHSYYKDLIQPLTKETFEIDIKEIVLDFMNNTELVCFINFLISENELNLKEISKDTKLNLEQLKELLYSIIDKKCLKLFSKYPVLIEREEINMIF